MIFIYISNEQRLLGVGLTIELSYHYTIILCDSLHQIIYIYIFSLELDPLKD
jgi:hypothetical protein